ncbi:hypothetical protein jhhlp_000067 [Lomentospora prolificans]|nr:hypothetical protein jhhlp_000067 [Lomentospora prolificans]
MNPVIESENDDASSPDGDVLRIMDLPEKFTVGYDSVSFTTQNFRGLKDIPHGSHFVWASASDASSMRTGFWFLTGPKEAIHVVQWDKFNDVLGDPASQTEVRIQKDNIPDLYPELPSYYALPTAISKGVDVQQRVDDLKENGIWRRLTSHITEKILKRITGRQTGPWHVHTTDRVKGSIILASERELEKTVSVVAVSELNFSFSQTDKTYSIEAIGSARTQQAVDSTAYLTSVIDTPESGLTDSDIVGEVQFAFIVGMHLGNESCVLQWWHMVLRILLRAFSLVVTKPQLSKLFIETLTAQLSYNESHLDGSILDYGVDSSRDLRLALTIFKRRLDEQLLTLNGNATNEQVAVGKAFLELESLAWKLGWDLRADYVRSGKIMLEDGEEVELDMDDLEAEDERGEFAAVVVEIDEHGRPKDMVSWD